MLYKKCGDCRNGNITKQVMPIGIAKLFNYYLIILWVSVMFTCFCILLFKTYKIYVEFLIEFQHHIQTFQLKITETYFILATSVINYCIKILSDNSTQNIFGIFLYQNKYLTISCIFRSGCYFRLWRERKLLNPKQNKAKLLGWALLSQNPSTMSSMKSSMSTTS